MIGLVQPLSLATREQMPAIKTCIKDAAFFTRDSLNFLDSGGRENRRLTLESMSRAVWNEDLALARKLLSTTILAREHIRIQDSRVCIINPPALEEAYRVYLDNRTLEDRAGFPKASVTEAAKLKGKISAARRHKHHSLPKSRLSILWDLSSNDRDRLLRKLLLTQMPSREA